MLYVNTLLFFYIRKLSCFWCKNKKNRVLVMKFDDTMEDTFKLHNKETCIIKILFRNTEVILYLRFHYLGQVLDNDNISVLCHDKNTGHVLYVQQKSFAVRA